MSRCDKLLRAARNNPAGLRFAEACHLAECSGFVLTRTKGSHHIYTHPDLMRPLPLQEAKNGTAKDYQVRQLLAAIEELSSPEGEQE